VSAPDHRPETLTIDIAQGPGEQSLTVPVLTEAPAPLPEEKPAPLAEPPRGPPVQRIAAGAAGLVGIAVASYAGLHAKAELDDSNADGNCQPHSNRCDATGVAERSSAGSAATVSTVLFIVGGVALAGGGVLWLTARPVSPPQAGVPPVSPPQRSTRSWPRVVPWLDLRGGGVVLRAEF
jgi:hypothetical protein